MRISGLSVTEAIREIVTRNRSIYDCMKMDIINYTALAVKIQPNVERQIGKSVNLNTIVVAIKRYADSFEQKKDLHDETLLKNARLSLTESMMDINLEHDAAGSDLTDLLEKFTQITQNYDLIKQVPGIVYNTETESWKTFMKFNLDYHFLLQWLIWNQRSNGEITVRAVITPMIASLTIFENIEINSEVDVITYGVLVILANIIMYVGTPLIALYILKQYLSRMSKNKKYITA